MALFVTCLVDLFRPSVGFAAVKLLEDAGCTVEVPPLQVCCGQPAYNSGDRATTRAIATQVIEAFQGYDAVVVPSGSCGGMLSHHYPGLFDDDPARINNLETEFRKVTPAVIQRTAKEYLKPSNRTVLTIEPGAAKGEK